ncbi:hypothetical protein [Kushneria sp. EE4]
MSLDPVGVEKRYFVAGSRYHQRQRLTFLISPQAFASNDMIVSRKLKIPSHEGEKRASSATMARFQP